MCKSEGKLLQKSISKSGTWVTSSMEPVPKPQTRMMGIKFSSRGQALVESALMLPFLAGITASFLFCLYFLFAILWADHWLYRANVCLIEGNSQWVCKTNFKNRMKVFIPQSFYQWQEFWITPRHCRGAIELQFFNFTMEKGHSLIRRRLTSDIPLPLRSRHSPTTGDSPWYTSLPSWDYYSPSF